MSDDYKDEINNNEELNSGTDESTELNEINADETLNSALENNDIYEETAENIVDGSKEIQEEIVHTYKEDESFYTTMETYTKKKKRKNIFKKTVTIGLVGSILCGSSLGICLGVGLNISKNLFVKSAQPFSFETASSNTEDASSVSVNITPSTDAVVNTINKVTNSIVNISIVTQTSTVFNQTYQSTGAGSGIIYSQDDEKVYIVTNNHVVEDATSVQISITGEEQIDAKLVGKDASSDLAVISVLKTDLAAAGIDSVECAVFGDSDEVEVGEYVIAIGNALGTGKTSTRGIISAKNKEINVDGKKLTMIQTDAAINPGNSGGALVNTKGEVIGINTAKTSSSSVEGTGYAIPTNVAKEVIASLMENGTVEKPYLGITGYTINDQFKMMYNISYDGVFIRSIESGSAAEDAGLQATDIITSFNGITVTSIEELSDAISKCNAGDKVTINIIRNGYEPMSIEVVLDNLNEQF